MPPPATDVPELAVPVPRGGPGVAAAGRLYFSEDSNAKGLYEINVQTGQATHLGQSGVTSRTVGLAPTDSEDLLYASKWSTLLHVKADGSGFTDVGGTGTEGLAFDGETLYGAINGQLFTMNPDNGQRLVTLAAPGADVEGLAYCARDHSLYGLAGFSGPRGDLFKYDIGSNSWRRIGNAGVAFNECGLAYDAGANVLYAKGSQDSFLYRLDPATAQATRIGDTGVAAGGGLALVGGSPTCVYTLKKSTPKGGCGNCPPKGGEYRTQTACEDVKDCDKKIKTIIACPNGGNGTCKLKGKRSSCG
ncbi:MAG: hypothetical protein C4547_15400 [Phycisphaerales bacterium]|nr:MAG: hypothetical protein C4547_15400 [Phycisphaerales bacterium]